MKRIITVFLVISLICIYLLPAGVMAMESTVCTALTAPVSIDGTVDAVWATATGGPIANQIGEQADATDLSGTFKTLWDASYLYVLWQITDQKIVTLGSEPWLKDGVEIYLDMDNSKSLTYGPNDFQFAFPYGGTTPVEYKWSVTTGIIYAYQATATGYVTEARIPFSTLAGFVPSAGMKVGLEIGVTDNDNLERETHKFWSTHGEEAYLHPSEFGVMTIQGQPGVTPPPAATTAPVYTPTLEPVSGPPVDVMPPVFTDYNGTELTALKAYGFIRAKVTATNKASSNVKATLIFALYSKSGAVKTFAFVEKELKPGIAESLNAGFSLPGVVTDMYVKVFVWDSLGQMTPLSQSYKFPYTAVPI